MACEPQVRQNHLYLYYVCAGEEHNRRNHCPGMRVRVDPIDRIAWEGLSSILKDPDKLRQEIDIFQDQANRQNAPTLEQLSITEDLLAENRQKLGRLVDLYMAGTFSLEDLQDRKTRLEESIQSLENQRAGMLSSLEGQILTPEQIDDIWAIAANLRERLDDATTEQKLQLFYILDVSGTLTLEGGEKRLSVFCKIRPRGNMFTINNIPIDCCGSRSRL